MKSISLTLVLFLLLSTAANGQPRKDIPFGFGTGGPAGSATTMLLTMPDVHIELALTPEQLSHLRSTLQKHRTERRDFLDNLLAGKVFESPVADHDLRQILDLYNRDFAQTLTLNLLASKQSKRLRELSLQLAGVASVYELATANALGLSDRQVIQLNTLRGQLSLRSGTMTVKDADQILEPILTSLQIARLRGMQGKPFEFEVLRHYVSRTQATYQALEAKHMRHKYVGKTR